MKVGYILLDGCADRPSAQLNYVTPLEAANTSFLDSLVRKGRMGRVVTVGRGISPESDIAVFSMLGYTFEEGYPGRGVIEAIGSGIDLEDGELAFRANFASVTDGLITDRRAGRDLTRHEVKELEEELATVTLEGGYPTFRGTVSYRGVLVIRADEALSSELSNTDPAYATVRGFGTSRKTIGPLKIQACRALSSSPVARHSARLVNEFTKKAANTLSESRVNKERVKSGKKPVNALLLRDPGAHVPKLEAFSERYGMKGVALVEMPAEVGIAKLIGMKQVRLKNLFDLEEMAELFKRELKENTVAYAHIKGADEYGHEGDAIGKKRFIDRIDNQFFGNIASGISDARIIVSCDHATPCVLRMHSSDPVPLLITKEGRAHDCCRFTETDSRRGSLGLLMGSKVLSMALSL